MKDLIESLDEAIAPPIAVIGTQGQDQNDQSSPDPDVTGLVDAMLGNSVVESALGKISETKSADDVRGIVRSHLIRALELAIKEAGAASQEENGEDGGAPSLESELDAELVRSK